MHNILLEIIEKKKKGIQKQKQERTIEELKKLIPYISNLSSFKEQILAVKKVALIAEIKFSSPTEQFLGSHDMLLERVIAYEQAGATAISYITEENFFKGNMNHIIKIKKETILPILQKDFVIDPYQIYQSRVIGSDALLLIAKFVSADELTLFVTLAQEIGLEPVVEVNDAEDLKKALQTKTEIIAVNSRNLETFEVSVDRACQLLRQIPDKFLKLGFSGIHSSKEVKQYKEAGAKGILVGTDLMKAKNIKEFIISLGNF